MSGHGAPKIQLDGAEGLTVAIVASSWHTEVMDGLVAGSEAALAEAGIEATLVRVAGSFELPVVAAQLARTHDAVIALGVIIRGGTPHFDYVCAAATDSLSRVALDSGTPIGFGLLTCDDEEQAIARAGLAGSQEDKGREATEAALSTAVTLRGLRA
ncbi:6,7-dimethyl-8-ribityllumazine synthase [Janibacter limosus]|uniref:6,7-dimethyl-8-ribityllumazine synthase n=1 Tax=Janibacter limosus TaxID=53458 RepID=A0A4P6MU39_9MICO|nr:6,7-dimethyl-8-ribityllumazine synthase [Janibacter limosus]QBF45257.1 6,7-dimethyl-8-ribityllumazine synthase [Janibacter limosus]